MPSPSTEQGRVPNPRTRSVLPVPRHLNQINRYANVTNIELGIPFLNYVPRILNEYVAPPRPNFKLLSDVGAAQSRSRCLVAARARLRRAAGETPAKKKATTTKTRAKSKKKVVNESSESDEGPITPVIQSGCRRSARIAAQKSVEIKSPVQTHAIMARSASHHPISAEKRVEIKKPPVQKQTHTITARSASRHPIGADKRVENKKQTHTITARSASHHPISAEKRVEIKKPPVQKQTHTITARSASRHPIGADKRVENKKQTHTITARSASRQQKRTTIKKKKPSSEPEVVIPDDSDSDVYIVD